MGGVHLLDIVTLLILYLSIISKENMAALFAFSQGLFMDIYSGGIYGLSPFLYLCVCLFIYILSNFIDINRRAGNMMIIFLAMLFKDLLSLLITYIFLDIISLNISFLRSLLLCIILTVFLSPAIFNLLNRLRYDEIV